MESITVDKDIYDFLQLIYFGGAKDPYEAASNRAYRDFNRTIRFNGLSDNIRLQLRTEVTALLKSEIEQMVCQISTQEDFNAWHYNLCTAIRDIYINHGIEFHYGQSQKWVNMTIKYLYISQTHLFEQQFSFLHIPIDNYIIDIAAREFHIPHPLTPWSRWDHYGNEYMQYQNTLRSKITDLPPLRWEFRNWLNEARKTQ